MKMKMKLMTAVSFSMLSGVLVANDNLDNNHLNTDDNKNVSFIIEENSSTKVALRKFVRQFDYRLKWDTEDFISAYEVSYEANSPEDILEQFVNDVRGNGKLIKLTLYKNNILVIENEIK